ncbi:MAG: Holliday junction resolvase RuvX [Flavobacteriaceae bacterium]|nr:Holliday junction resolvase RuvX [Flavobacteriaceae bacterium]MCY4216827.1 Holliday junction resolvase RuvX [Flavobacteriaceae bacterium]MCY4253387.1 Holliday junction resolvase RuvX [Flavobacteriaceae bacterium]
MSQLLAIDYGTKRVGLAISDPQQKISSPLKTVPLKLAIENIQQISQDYQIETIILGIPKQKNGQYSEIINQIKEFEVTLNTVLPTVRIIHHEERYTSKMAQRIVLESGLKKQKRKNKSLLDKISASILLESYIESVEQSI